MAIRFWSGAWLLLLAMASTRAAEPLPTSAFALPDDLEITQWARAPQFFNPTNIDVDIRGRVWVAEAVNYRRFKAQDDRRLRHEQGDRIVVLEDTDADGQADASHVFVQDADLVAPLGVAVMGNRIVVSCSPALIVYTDVDGNAQFDPQIDKKETLLTGFGGLDHDHGLHAAVAGPDGRWYFNVGNAGAHTVTDRSGWTLRAGSWYTGGTPYNTANIPGRKSDDGRVYVGGLAMAIEPDGTGLAVFAHNFRNNYETCLDSLGNVFQNDNDDQVTACRTTWLMQYANAGYSSADGRRSWQADRRPDQSVPQAHWHQDDPGVIPMGDLYGAGSPTGMAVYESDALGGQYRGMLLSCEAGRNAVFGYHVRPHGAGFDLERFSLLSSGLPDDVNYKWNEVQQDSRRWFRPSDVAIGPDGAIYVADWFDPIVGGHAMHDQVGSGAIYRIAPKGRRLTTPQIDLATIPGQIEALRSPSPNVRFLGFERLRAAGPQSLDAASALLTDSNPFVRARAIWLLAQLGDSGRAIVRQLLKEGDADTRIVALRALRPATSKTQSPDASANFDELQQLAHDPSPAVRREVALSLRDVPIAKCRSLLASLAAEFDGLDRWYLEAWGAACDGREDAVYEALVEKWPAKSPLDWDDRFAALVWRLHPARAIASLLVRAASDQLEPARRRQAIDTLAFVPAREAAQAMTALAADGPADLREYARWWSGFRRNNLWRSYLEILPTTTTRLPTAADPQLTALERLVLDSAADFDQRRAAARTMVQSTAGAMRLIALAAREKLAKELTAALADEFARHREPAIRALASQFFSPTAKQGEPGPAVEELARISGDAVHGRKLVLGRAECAKCHRFDNEGKSIGPDLSGIGRKLDRTRLLDAILNPSSAIATGYETWLISTGDGRLFSGFVIGEGETVLLKDAEGNQHDIPANEIEYRKQQTVSLMPQIGSLQLTSQDLADIAEFLSQQQSDIATARP